MVQVGDLVDCPLLDTWGAIVHWTGAMGDHCVLMDRAGDTALAYIDGLQPRLAPPEVRDEIMRFAASREGQKRIRHILDPSKFNRGAPAVPWQIPWQIADERGAVTDEMLRYMGFWRLKWPELLAELESHNSDWHGAVLWMAEGRPAADLAELWGVKASLIYKWAQLGRAWLRERLAPYQGAYRLPHYYERLMEAA